MKTSKFQFASNACDILHSFHRSSNYKCRGIYSMTLILELEDRRRKFQMRCILHDDAIASTGVLLDNLTNGTAPTKNSKRH
ncbi:hypothetical protein QN277_022531 [Acacia crassicarpa]|uniref:Uncharacterized protein n=1 Tax=Acacia crassicarpa TaxID=499986 RepID=A0AAE1JF51_9FABA|nr:hypothetical protein QN277_022531 [Acacia crassicarpa]